MPEIHLCILVIKDCILVIKDYILYNLPNIKWNVLDNDIIEQGPLGRHFTHISRRNETRCDEVLSYLRNVGHNVGLKQAVVRPQNQPWNGLKSVLKSI